MKSLYSLEDVLLGLGPEQLVESHIRRIRV